MTDKLFTIVGVSTYGNITKFRVANGSASDRTKVLARYNHTGIDLVELEGPMTKIDAIEWYKTKNPEYKDLPMPNAAKLLKAAAKSKDDEKSSEEVISEETTEEIAELETID